MLLPVRKILFPALPTQNDETKTLINNIFLLICTQTLWGHVERARPIRAAAASMCPLAG